MKKKTVFKSNKLPSDKSIFSLVHYSIHIETRHSHITTHLLTYIYYLRVFFCILLHSRSRAYPGSCRTYQVSYKKKKKNNDKYPLTFNYTISSAINHARKLIMKRRRMGRKNKRREKKNGNGCSVWLSFRRIRTHLAIVRKKDHEPLGQRERQRDRRRERGKRAE